MINGKSYPLHRLVCAEFHGLPLTPEHVCNHKERNSSNSTPDNLEWCTRAENSQHANTLPRKCNAGSRSKPVRARRVDTEEEWVEFESTRAAARKLGLDQRAISAVANGTRKSTGGYEFDFLPQCEEIEGEVWKDVILPP